MSEVGFNGASDDTPESLRRQAVCVLVSPCVFELWRGARMVNGVMRELIDSVGGSAAEIVIVLAMAGAIVGLVTYIIRRVVRRTDIMTLQVEELRSAQARAESERALSDHKLEASRERQRDMIDLIDVKFGVMVDRYEDMRRDVEELREGLREIRARIDEDD